jgi:hypothetical protein
MKSLNQDQIKLISQNIKPHNIVFCSTTPVDYEMSRIILIEDVPEINEKYIVVEGSHCSCYGFEEIAWYATTYTKNELLKLANTSWPNSYANEKILADFIKVYLE